MPSGHTQHSFTLSGHTQKVGCMWRLIALCSVVCLSLWQPSDASRLRCGSDLLADLIFVCGDRGIYLGRGSWSGYGSRPRGKGIVEQCCHSAGCDLRHLEMYCAKSKKPEPPTTTTTTTTSTTTTSTTTTSSTTSTTTSIPSSIHSSATTSTATSTPTSTPTVALQFEAVFQKRLLEHLGAPDSQRRSNARRKTHSSPRRRKVSSTSRKGAARQQPASKFASGSQQSKLS
ncbi:insulin-like growth factor I, juvenile form [Gadus morhua]|uniref:insulin-like growth factor I, juvenile form n=1 Tax=Gadus morhua TaxID=8049 RepID=UPI0011B63B80|nr:insulin-like growth factor I, juvenile form [Gadus morhua]